MLKLSRTTCLSRLAAMVPSLQYRRRQEKIKLLLKQFYNFIEMAFRYGMPFFDIMRYFNKEHSCSDCACQDYCHVQVDRKAVW